MATSPIGATSSAAITPHHEGASGPSLRPGSPDAFTHFQPHAQGPLVRLDSAEDIFFDARSSFSSVDEADMPSPEEVAAQHRSLRTLLPDLMTSLASLRDSAVQQFKTKVKDMADHGMGATANIEAKRQLAEEHGCTLAHPFNQNKFLFDKTIDDREFAADYARLGGDGHCCFGLSANWCQSRAKGESSETFFSQLENHYEHALLPRALSFQHVEQQRFEDKIQNAAPMLLDTLPKLGMALGKAPDGVHDAHFSVGLDTFVNELNRLLKPGQDQIFLLFSESHAMALHQDSENRLHFFDPLYGVVQADTPDNMTDFLDDVFNRDARSHWRGNDRRLQLSEIVPGPAFHTR